MDDKFDTNNGRLTAQVGGEVYRPSHCYVSRGANLVIVEGGGEGDIRMGEKEERNLSHQLSPIIK